MTGVTKRHLVAALLAAVLVAAVAAVLFQRENSGEVAARPAQERPELLLLTSLPIVFPEEFTLEEGGSPALEALQRRYRVIPVSTSDAQSLAGHRLMLMAQPNAQAAQALVDLDQWVRGGGRLLLLADPVLEWPSELPLGDVQRPALSFADTGLLGHWGLRLDAPERIGPASFELRGDTVLTLSPGLLVAIGGQCEIDTGGLVARCQIGGGRVAVIADADFIDAEPRRLPASSGITAVLLTELARLEH